MGGKQLLLSVSLLQCDQVWEGNCVLFKTTEKVAIGRREKIVMNLWNINYNNVS